MSEGDSKATPVQMPTGSGTRRAPEASIIKTEATDLLATPSTRHAASDAEATSSGPAVDDAAAATAADCSSGGGGASSGGGGDILRYEIVLTGVIWAVLMGSYQDHAPRITLIPLHLGALLLANFVLYKVRVSTTCYVAELMGLINAKAEATSTSEGGTDPNDAAGDETEAARILARASSAFDEHAAAEAQTLDAGTPSVLRGSDFRRSGGDAKEEDTDRAEEWLGQEGEADAAFSGDEGRTKRVSSLPPRPVTPPPSNNPAVTHLPPTNLPPPPKRKSVSSPSSSGSGGGGSRQGDQTSSDEELELMLIGRAMPSPTFVVQCTANILIEVLPALSNLIDHLPGWCGQLRAAMWSAIEERAYGNSSVMQLLFWMVESESLERDGPGSKMVKRGADLTKHLFGKDDLKATMKQLEAVPKGCALVLSDITIKHFYDPFSVDGVRVRGIKLEKIFNSNAKPMLLSLHFFRDQSPSLGLSATPASSAGVDAGIGAGANGGAEEEEDIRRSATRSEVDRVPRLVIYKAGDDLRKDVAVLQVFRMMNALWEREKLSLKIDPSRGSVPPVPCRAHLYGVVPIDKENGFIELIPDVRSLTELGKDELNSRQLDQMIASAAASYTGAHLLGIKDRHSDNILITKGGTCFHIDFGHVLGDAVTLDTADFAITPDFKRCLGDRWGEFVDLCVKAFVVLYRYAPLVIDYSVAQLALVAPASEVRPYLESRLLAGDMLQASQNVRKLIESGPSAYATQLKNAMHQAAMMLKTGPKEGPSRSKPYHEMRRLVAEGWMNKRGEMSVVTSALSSGWKTRYFVLYGRPVGGGFDADRLTSSDNWASPDFRGAEGPGGRPSMVRSGEDGLRLSSTSIAEEEGAVVDADDILVRSTLPPDDEREPSTASAARLSAAALAELDYDEEFSPRGSAVMYYFNTPEAHKKMAEDKVSNFKGAIEFSDITEIRIAASEKSDSYVLVTSKREWELQIESKRELWKAALLRNVPAGARVANRTSSVEGDNAARRRAPSLEDAMKIVTGRGSSPPPSRRSTSKSASPPPSRGSTSKSASPPPSRGSTSPPPLPAR
mmetsp:Transcript_57840/g.159683  ORF Transcript_57840/g.159683 Transcript_57840/m.159683 type:complete len:1068 (-) Transcript_57840:292-3495(-)